MFRVSLYREFHAKRREARRRTVRTATVTGLVTLQVFVIASLALSSILLRERAGDLQEEVQRLSRPAATPPLDPAQAAAARDLVEVKRTRIEWTPKLAAIAEKLPSSLRLAQITGQTAGPGRPSRLSMSGHVSGGGASIRSVSAFVDLLRADSRLASDLPRIRVETLGGSEVNRFDIACEPILSEGGGQP